MHNWGNVVLHMHDVKGTNNTVNSIILSKQNNDIRKWLNWLIRAKNALV